VDGVIAETYLLPGKQESHGTVPGLSQVDKCVRQSGAVAIMQMMNDARAYQQLHLADAVR
jgi:hypothetical protein